MHNQKQTAGALDNSVFRLTVVPSSSRSKELFILSIRPGVPSEMVAKAVSALGNTAQRRGADFFIAADMTVDVKPPLSWFGRLRARLAVNTCRADGRAS